jgi:hypothetical protein
MKITVEFETWDEMEAFRTSGKKTRGKKDEPEITVEEVTAAVAANTPPQAQPQFTPPPVAVQPPAGFPGANGITPPPSAVHPLVTAIVARIDGAISTGQSTDAIAGWFRQQIGPEAANATLDQIKQIFVPRMSEAQLRQLAPQLGIQG